MKKKEVIRRECPPVPTTTSTVWSAFVPINSPFLLYNGWAVHTLTWGQLLCFALENDPFSSIQEKCPFSFLHDQIPPPPHWDNLSSIRMWTCNFFYIKQNLQILLPLRIPQSISLITFIAEFLGRVVSTCSLQFLSCCFPLEPIPMRLPVPPLL